MNATRRLIVNADDFGLSQGVNRGIIAAHEVGIVTSASLMVRGPAAAEAAAYARAHPRLSVGLHVDLGEWAFRGGAWVELYRVVPLDDAAAVAAEVTRQLEAFRRLAGCDPTHLDSHQHVHRKEPVQQVVTAVAAGLGVPLRHFTPGIVHCGEFYGQDGEGLPYPHLIRPSALLAILERLRPGVTELGCHPGERDLPDTMYDSERRDEVRALCDPGVRQALGALGIERISFRELSRAPAADNQGQSST
jgi:predicted glycoside hydrolase/deacetylase ChbG (UPF0249 family)